MEKFITLSLILSAILLIIILSFLIIKYKGAN